MTKNRLVALDVLRIRHVPAGVKRDWPRPLFRRMALPNLIPNWIVWVPVSPAVFSFPFPLQIHVNGIVCTFWTLMCLQIGRRT